MNKFKKDRQYLLKYCAWSLLVFTILNTGIFYLKGIDFHISITHYDWLWPLSAVLLCAIPSSIMHNCAHGNIHPRWLNNLIGELCGTIMLYGFRGFALAHMFHHIYPDDPQMDPHPPKGHNFISFLFSPIKATLLVVERAYYQNFGKSKTTSQSIKIQTFLFNVNLLARTLFWLLLLGPKFFLLAYLPIYAANIFVFAHINFAAHIENTDGNFEIIDINHNLYYRYINIVSFGGYFHKSHHLKPGAFNPSRVRSGLRLVNNVNRSMSHESF